MRSNAWFERTVVIYKLKRACPSPTQTKQLRSRYRTEMLHVGAEKRPSVPRNQSLEVQVSRPPSIEPTASHTVELVEMLSSRVTRHPRTLGLTGLWVTQQPNGHSTAVLDTLRSAEAKNLTPRSSAVSCVCGYRPNCRPNRRPVSGSQRGLVRASWGSGSGPGSVSGP